MATTGVRFAPRSGESWRDPFPMYRALQDDDPVHRVDDGGYWVLSRFADVFAAARDTATFSSAEGLTFTYDERRKAGLEEFAPWSCSTRPPTPPSGAWWPAASRRATWRRSSPRSERS